MKNPELKTIIDYIRFACTSFTEAGLYYGHGTNNAWDEALALVLHSLHLAHDINPLVLNANLTEAEQLKLEALIEARINKRIPVPYLTHQAWFAGLSFYVDERVLVPRSPIAELIEEQFQPWATESVSDILDLCTGSACIAIACAKAFPNAQVDASDISEEALAVAKINVLRHQVEDQVELYQSDLFSALPEKKYDIIVSNPPYVGELEMSTLPAEYGHEPKQGLFAAHEGLDFAVRILQQANKFLKPEGILVLEVGNSENALAAAFPTIPFTWLDFERGGGGVLIITADQLKKFAKQLNKFESTL